MFQSIGVIEAAPMTGNEEAKRETTMAKMQIGATYIQTFANGDRVYFTPLELCKNESWRGDLVRQDAGSRRRKPVKTHVTRWGASNLWTLVADTSRKL